MTRGLALLMNMFATFCVVFLTLFLRTAGSVVAVWVCVSCIRWHCFRSCPTGPVDLLGPAVGSSAGWGQE